MDADDFPLLPLCWKIQWVEEGGGVDGNAEFCRLRISLVRCFRNRTMLQSLRLVWSDLIKVLR